MAKKLDPNATAGAQTPNVQLAAKAEPLGAGPVTAGMEVVCELPDEAAQRAGFYCEAADRLIAIYPGRFKLITEKGK